MTQNQLIRLLNRELRKKGEPTLDKMFTVGGDEK